MQVSLKMDIRRKMIYNIWPAGYCRVFPVYQPKRSHFSVHISVSRSLTGRHLGGLQV